jgi:hypothetical protein
MQTRSLFALLGLSFACTAASAANAPVNIVYPINNGSYQNYFTSSFGATCSGGQHTAEWGFDNTTVGTGTYYDQISVQFSHKLPTGSHVFWVKTSCGVDRVVFNVL